MGPAQNQDLIDELSSKQDQITESKSWDELGEEEKLERLRGFVKQSMNTIIRNQEQEISRLTQRIQDLESHKHNDRGDVIVERRLGEIHDQPMKYNYASSPTVAAPGMSIGAKSGGYI